MCIYVYICAYMCIYVYIDMYVYAYTLYIHMYIQKHNLPLIVLRSVGPGYYTECIHQVPRIWPRPAIIAYVFGSCNYFKICCCTLLPD